MAPYLGLGLVAGTPAPGTAPIAAPRVAASVAATEPPVAVADSTLLVPPLIWGLILLATSVSTSTCIK